MKQIMLFMLFVFYLAFEQTSGGLIGSKPEQKIREGRPKNCAEASNNKTGIFTIEIPHTDLGHFLVACDAKFESGNWLVIQRRMNGDVDFYRPWAEYKTGFGEVNGEFFIGLDKLHYITMYKPHELIIVMEDFTNTTKIAKYTDFAIGNEAELYNLKRLGTYSGSSGDSFSYHKSQNFSTYDNDNDGLSDVNCASRHVGGWWYKSCLNSNLNGLYMNGKYQAPWVYGIDWYTFEHEYLYSLKFTQMMIRPQAGYYN